ncbi:hypothetical protein HYV85_06330 [Candidatus Woesearchaeota archaeon]|nr:hypothetical protein [Candidatus Woesearchaeota archaeon]
MRQLFSKHNTALYDWLFWLSLFITGLWFALKIAGFIKTPFWIEFVPVASIIFGAGIFFQKVEHIGDDLHDFKTEMREFKKETHQELSNLSTRVTRIEAKLS